MSFEIQINQTAHPLEFPLALASDHITPATGLTPTVTLSKNGGSFAAPAGAISETGNGWYKVAGNATDANTLGLLKLHATATGADPEDVVYQVVAYNPDDGVRMGLSALPNANAAAAGGLPTAGTGANQLSTSGGGVNLNAGSVYAQALVPFQATVTQVLAAPTVSGFEMNSLPAYNDKSFSDYVVMAGNGAIGGEFHRIRAWNHLTKWADFVTPWTQVLPAGTLLNLMPWGGSDALAADSLARLLGLTAENMVEDDVFMDANGSGYRISWNYYLYDTAAHATAHVTGGGGGTGLLYKYAVLREIVSGIVKRATVTRTL